MKTWHRPRRNAELHLGTMWPGSSTYRACSPLSEYFKYHIKPPEDHNTQRVR